jgi:hypothetical protein
MAHVSAGRFAGKTQKVKLNIDQKVRSVALKAGDTCDLEVAEATYLKNIGRAEFVSNDEPKTAAR